MQRKMWGGNQNWMGWIPVPSSGMTKTVQGYSEAIDYENGGRDVVRSYAQNARYELSFPASAGRLVGGVSIINKLANGYYGPGPFYFSDPMNKESNLFSPNWASPGMIENGDWKNIYPLAPTFSNTPANNWDLPLRQATWNITGASVTPGFGMYEHVIPVPRDDVLWLGATGTTTGTGGVFVRLFKNGVATQARPVAMYSATDPVRMTTNILGSEADYVKIYLSRTSTAASTVTLAALSAQIGSGVDFARFIYPSPNLFPGSTVYATAGINGAPIGVIGAHYPGEGNSGLEFDDNAIVETYVQAGRRLKSMTTKLSEVGSWR